MNPLTILWLWINTALTIQPLTSLCKSVKPKTLNFKPCKTFTKHSTTS